MNVPVLFCRAFGCQLVSGSERLVMGLRQPFRILSTVILGRGRPSRFRGLRSSEHSHHGSVISSLVFDNDIRKLFNV